MSKIFYEKGNFMGKLSEKGQTFSWKVNSLNTFFKHVNSTSDVLKDFNTGGQNFSIRSNSFARPNKNVERMIEFQDFLKDNHFMIRPK